MESNNSIIKIEPVNLTVVDYFYITQLEEEILQLTGVSDGMFR